MKKKLAILFMICCVGILIAGAKTCYVKAEANMMPGIKDNLRTSLIAKSRLAATDDGYVRVYYDGEKVRVESYDDEFNIKSKKSIDMELDIWGGFYAGEDAYYLVEGQNNKEEDDSAEVIRVIKYDKNWNKLGTAKITGNSNLFGGEVRYPFNTGCVEMTEWNGTLYIVTGHEGYVDASVGQGHQGFLMIVVNEESMIGKIVESDLWHSFAQYIEYKNEELYVLEQSEGSRYTKLSKYDANNLQGTSIPVLKYGGVRTSPWAIPCYATVDGMALSSNNVLCIGTSIDQSKYDEVNSDTAYNVYLTVTPMSDFTEDATTVKWLTNFSDEGKYFTGLKITKINDDRFMVSWQIQDEEGTANDNDTLSRKILHYIFIDGNGNKVGREYTAPATISECQPIIKNSKIVYYASNSNMVNFYIIDAQTGEFSKKEYRVAGDDATWELENGVLTVSGTGKVYLGESWEALHSKVKKIVIESGVTSISDNGLSGFSNVTEININQGLVSIGEQAFRGCSNLKKITIPSSVVEIGKDFLQNFWGTLATIYAPENSYAAEYARKNGIPYIIDNSAGIPIIQGDIDISNATISGVDEEYLYMSEGVAPEPLVILDGKKLVFNKDYVLSYVNNTFVGSDAKVVIIGIGDYKGRIEKTFSIYKIEVKNPKITYSSTDVPKAGNIKEWIKDNMTIEYKGNVLIYGTDYEYGSYTYNDEGDINYVNIYYIGSYSGSSYLQNISLTIIEDIDEQEYTGKPIVPDIIVRDIHIYTRLVKDKDYTISCSNNTESGTAVVKIIGTGEYFGTTSSSFNIIKKTDISHAEVTGIEDTYLYQNAEIKPIPTVMLDSHVLTLNKDYKLEYSDCRREGTATLKIIGIGLYKGTIIVHYDICTIKVINPTITYKSNINPTSQNIKSWLKDTVVVQTGEYTLNYGTDYDVYYSCDSDGLIGIVGIGFMGAFSGEYVELCSIRETHISTIGEQIYTGKPIIPKFYISNYEKNLVENIDYKISYSNNINIGTATITITGIGRYFGSREITFNIVSGSQYNDSEHTAQPTLSSNQNQPVSLKKVTNLKLVSKKKAIKLSWKKQKNVSYQVRYSTKKNMAKAKKKTTGKNSYTLKKLKAKKTYYVQVRSRYKVDGKWYYGKWSAKKKIKTK